MEAMLWQKNAVEHQSEGHRAFTGAGYQEQHRRVQEQLDAMGGKPQRADEGDRNEDSTVNYGRSGFFETLSKAIFGPAAGQHRH